jgi:hypothetical protein
VHVVHRQDDRPTLGAALQMLAENTQQVELIYFVQIAGEKLSERAEGERTHRFRSSNPFTVMAVRRAKNLVDQSGFSDARAAGDQHSRSVRVRDGIGNETLFLGSPHHWPPFHAP